MAMQPLEKAPRPERWPATGGRAMTQTADAQRLSSLSGQVTAVSGHVDRVDANVLKLAERFGALGQRLDSVDRRMERLETNDAAIRDDIRTLGQELQAQIAGLADYIRSDREAGA